MLDEIIKDLALRNCFTEIPNAEWLNLSNAVANEPDELKRAVFIKALSTHSGVPIVQVQTAFASLTKTPFSEEQEQILADLQKTQGDATLKISTFQQRSIFKNMDVDALSLSRAQWNTMITRFEQKNREKLTRPFFLSTLSAIKKTSFENLNSTLSRAQPERQSKRKHQREEESVKRTCRRTYREDNGINPLIFESVTKNFDLEDKLEATGVRVVGPLFPATPEKGYHHVKQTPGGTKVRPVCRIAQHTFFKHLTPYKDRANVLDASRGHVAKTLPKLVFGRAEPVAYIATLESITQRAGMMRRQTQRSVTGASAADVFRAHGVTITPAEGRSKHWAHLIAHFLGDPQDIITEDAEQEVINLIPSTAEANYNTLEAVELFIREQLVKQNTDKIHIHVMPVYSGESLIPDSLVYTLDWSKVDIYGEHERHNEVFYINPQSQYRLTKSMHQSIAVLREIPDVASSLKMETDDNTDPNAMRISL